MATILVVEDDEHTRILTKARLKSRYDVLVAENGEEALEIFYENKIDLIVADVMMPKMDGFHLVRQLRKEKESVPVILLTAKSAFEDKREGFQMGTDDYLTKPVNYEELIWRIQSLLRRANIHSEQMIRQDGLTLEEKKLTITRDASGESVELSPKEFALLYKMALAPGQIFTKDQLMTDIWGYDSDSEESTIKTHINRLRSKLMDFPELEVVTVRGLGYKFLWKSKSK